MKTRLLLFALFISNVINAQIGISEGFESGALPVGWTNNGFGFPQNSGFPNIFGFGATNAATIVGESYSLTTVSQISDGGAIPVSLFYRKTQNVGCTFGIYYQIGNNATLNLIAQQFIGGAIANYTQLSGTIPAGTIPAGISVKFVISVIGVGSVSGLGSIFFDNFLAGTAMPTLQYDTVIPVSANTFEILYQLNANNSNTTSVINWGSDASNLSNQIIGFAAVSNTNTSGSALLSGLTPSTIYYFQISAVNQKGTTTSNVFSFFSDSSGGAITKYSFDNTLNSAFGSSPFSAPNTSFVNDRRSQAQSAIRVGSTTVPTTATITNLPIGSNERTISFWHKKPTHSVPVGLFAYGTSGSLQTCGIYLLGNGNYVFQGSVTDVTFPSSATAANAWVNTVVSYKNGVVRLYNNGTFVASTNLTLNTGSSTFRLGGIGAIVEFDDLQIYNYELSAAQVGELYNNNSLSSKDFSTKNLKASLYPNPVKDFLNIETDTEIKSVAIYNLLGQKVKTANSRNVNVSDLSNGTYMVRVEDTNNAVETMKIIKQ